MEKILEFVDLSIYFRVLLCFACGGALGIERERRHRNAGVKTHTLVCLGAAICMMSGEYAVNHFQVSAIDPTRIGAQVVSGIGFLGVGTIIVTKNHKVKGLTTAAGLWVSACIGLAIGIGFYEMAVCATISVLLMFIIVKKIKILDYSISTSLYIELAGQEDVRTLLETIKAKKCTVLKFAVKSSMEHSVGLFVDIHGKEKLVEELLMEIQTMSCVTFYEEFE